MYAIGSQLVHRIFLPLENLGISEKEKFNTLAYSPLCVVKNVITGNTFVISCTCEGKTYNALIRIPDERILVNFLPNYQTWKLEIIQRIGITFKKKFTVDIFKKNERSKEYPHVLARSIFKENEIAAFDIYLPIDFVSYLLGEIITEFDSVEHIFERYLSNDAFLFPNISLIIDIFQPMELEMLFARLRQKKLLSIYQIALICTAFPEHAVKIKHALSKNTVSEVREMMNKIRVDATFGHRDILEGIYSVEAAIYHLIQCGENWKDDEFFDSLRNLVNIIHVRNMFEQKCFAYWLECIEHEGLMYHTLISTSDQIIANAFYDEKEMFEKYCGKCLSKRRLEDIRRLWEYEPSLTEKMHARFKIISAFRNLRVIRKNWGSESFDFVMRNIADSASINTLVREVGWYVISTALKNARKDIVKRIVTPLPKPAKYLIEDVLRGVINPNILHSEMQINEARSRCVQKALELYEKGFIEIIM